MSIFRQLLPGKMSIVGKGLGMRIQKIPMLTGDEVGIAGEMPGTATACSGLCAATAARPGNGLVST